MGSIERWSNLPEENPEEEKRILEEFRKRDEIEKAAKHAKYLERKLKKEVVPYAERIPESLKPSDKQKVVLEDFDVELLPTKKLNSRQINFILKGNGAEPKDMDKWQRAAYLIEAQRSWKGKKVMRNDNSQEGVVRYVFPKTIEEVSAQVEAHTDGDIALSPLLATVDFEGDKEGKVISFYYISKVE